MGLLNVLRTTPKEHIINWIYATIEKYHLSLVSKNGYEFYHCESSTGLGEYNKKGFNQLRETFNSKENMDAEYFLMLYLLIVYSFNNQLRFNGKGKFNLPVGKRDFNKKMQSKLFDFIDRIKNSDYKFTNEDFRNIHLDDYTNKSFFYVDPPYLITCATYNEKSGWTEKDERDLLCYLEKLDSKGIRFALSNVLESKGTRNEILSNWLNQHEKYRVIHLNYDYKNSNYHKKNHGITKEILVLNY